MATKYEEMREAVNTARKNAEQYRERCWKYMNLLFTGFVRYCAIPPDCVTLLKWNGIMGEGSAFESAEPSSFTMMGATVLGDDGFWRLGLRISLGSGAVQLAFAVAEQDGIPVIRGADKPRPIDFSDQQQCNDFYDEVVGKIKAAFIEPQKPKGTTFGFIVQTE